MPIDTVPAVESTWDRSRREWNLLIRRPFYTNLRLGATQNALWVGSSFDGERGGRFVNIFNRFPLRNALGGWRPVRPYQGETKPSA